jgi:hypothetical protein
MARTLEIAGHTWTCQGDRSCAHCGARTFKISRREGNELMFAVCPGPSGNHTFTRGGPQGIFAICTLCFERTFGGDRRAVLEWFDQRESARVVRMRPYGTVK